MHRTYHAIEGALVTDDPKQNETVGLTLDNQLIAIFYPPSFANGVWRAALEKIKADGDRVICTDRNGRQVLVDGRART